MKSLNILLIATEAAPYAKSGGLADMVIPLVTSLQKLGHNLIVVLPLYARIDRERFNIQPTFSNMKVFMGEVEEQYSIHKSTHQDGAIVYFIEHSIFFDRHGLYSDVDNNDFIDNPKRFAFFSRASLTLCRELKFKPDIIHVHDWQTALVPAYLKVLHINDSILKDAASLLTIHNIGYQGVYNAGHFEYIGFKRINFNVETFEDHGRINYLKGGIHYADMVNTVSLTYADETRIPEMGYGLAPHLINKCDNYTGILNGVDYTLWNPEVDTLIPANYSLHDLTGKQDCKRELQRRFLLDEDESIPVLGVVSRLAHQKGLDILAGAIEEILNNMRIQFVLLGSGDIELERSFSELPARFPGRAGVSIGYSNELAHWIEAGADMFLMPSRYEPCGLNQIYSLKYGTLPVVRATGGLVDTVEQYDESTGTGTGFMFNEASAHALYYTVGWAVSTYYDRPDHFYNLQQKAMRQSFSWEDSAKEYIKAYMKAIRNKKNDQEISDS